MTSLNLEFGGGLEALFNDKKKLAVSPPSSVKTLGSLISWVKTNLITQRHDLFASGDSLRPGILVLINEVDWELEDTVNYTLQNNDCIAFISTLHGG